MCYIKTFSSIGFSNFIRRTKIDRKMIFEGQRARACCWKKKIYTEKRGRKAVDEKKGEREREEIDLILNHFFVEVLYFEPSHHSLGALLLLTFFFYFRLSFDPLSQSIFCKWKNVYLMFKNIKKEEVRRNKGANERVCLKFPHIRP